MPTLRRHGTRPLQRSTWWSLSTTIPSLWCDNKLCAALQWLLQAERSPGCHHASNTSDIDFAKRAMMPRYLIASRVRSAQCNPREWGARARGCVATHRVEASRKNTVADPPIEECGQGPPG